MSDVDALCDRLIAERLTARPAEILAAVARVEYYNRQYNAGARTVDALTCPPALAALTPVDLAARLPEFPESAGAEAIGRDEALGFLAGDVAGYVTGGRAPGPSLGMDLPALFAIAAPGRGAGAAKVEHRVRYVHRRWLAYHAGALRMESTDDNLLRWTAPPVGGWPAVAHPLAPLVAAWQVWRLKRGDTPDKVHVLVNQERRPPQKTEPLRLARMPGLLALVQAPLEAVEVDGEPLVSVTPDARFRYRVLPPEQGDLFPAPRTLDKRATGGALVEAIASVPLGGDERSPLRADLLRIGTLAYALTGSVRLTPGEMSTLIVGSDTPQGREQALTLVWLMRSMAIAPAGEPWAAFDAEPGAVHRIGPPGWWLDQTGPRAYRLVGALFRRMPGAGRKAARWGVLERTLSGIEGALLWGPTAGKGRGGRLPDAVRPVRRGGPGAPVRIPWHLVLRVSGEHVTPEMLGAGTDTLNKRYQRRVGALEAVGYFVPETGGAAPAGDTIEIVRQVKGGRHHEAAIVVRATARFCAAYATGAEQTRLPASHLLSP